jgi:hypothetical protein
MVEDNAVALRCATGFDEKPLRGRRAEGRNHGKHFAGDRAEETVRTHSPEPCR